MAHRRAIAELVAPLVPAGAALAVLAIEGPEPPVFAEEEPAVARAVAKRRRELAFGRACARTALAALGIAPTAIPTGEAGAPAWPTDITGSITHTDEHAAAVVARIGAIQGVGVDLESLAHAGHTPDLLASVTTANERRHLGHLALPVAALVFSAKESVYKCLYPTSRRFLDFPDVELAIDPAGTFLVTRAAGCDPRALRGRFACSATHVATLVVSAR